MTSPRITDSGVRMRSLASMQRTLARTQTAQDQISSGKQLRRPSDSPTGTVSALQLRGEMRANQKYAANADDAAGRLGSVQDTLQGSMGLVSKVRELSLAASSAGGGSTSQANAARAAFRVRRRTGRRRGADRGGDAQPRRRAASSPG